jgi:molybdate transport system substrate-binding protein
VRRALVGALLVLALAGCGGDNSELTVYAASSLTEVFRELDTDARFNFAGSDELATQIREGARADIYAAASPRYPAELLDEGLVEEPQVFATNRLVLVVPRDNPAGIESVDDLNGVRLVAGAEGVPVGDYTRTVLENMGASEALDGVVSNEDDVKGVVGKVASGEADAGFVYVTDYNAARDELLAIELPDEAQADVSYPIAVVAETENREAAEAFVELVLGDEGQQALADAGFGPP